MTELGSPWIDPEALLCQLLDSGRASKRRCGYWARSVLKRGNRQQMDLELQMRTRIDEGASDA